jgi:type II secretory ATPase GspE/PulE/Tfp pilus assembly ATPase PilB-like protein
MKTMMEEIGMKWIPIKNMKLYTWVWCEACWHSWYKWRIWIFEIINLSTNIRDLIRAWASSEEIFKEARNGNLVTMREDWILKAMWWYITIEELLRVI